MKILLILVDGMRPDALQGVSKAQEFMERSAHTLRATTVVPSVTLPCHMSLFHSADPSRHGVTTNVYSPQVRPVKGLCEVLRAHHKTCAFFYNWEELRDLARPGSLEFSYYCKGEERDFVKANQMVTDACIEYLRENPVDFAFLYLGRSDDAGHNYGWMSPEYLQAVSESWDNIQKAVDSLPEDYTVIVTADHGGHDRIHGKTIPEDMTIPIMIRGKDIPCKDLDEAANLKDIAPTVAKLLGAEPDAQWEGKCLL